MPGRLLAECRQPVEHSLLPLGLITEIVSKTPAVAARRVDVHRGPDAVLLQGVVVARAAHGGNRRVVVRQQQQRRRCLVGHLAFERIAGIGLCRAVRVADEVVERPLVPRMHGDDRIEEQREVGTHGSQRRDIGRQMTSGREAHDADRRAGEALGSGLIAPQQPQRLFGILERHLRMTVRHAVFQYGGRDAVRGQPLCHLEPFVVDGQPCVTAARADHHADPRLSGLRRVGRVEVEFGCRGVGQPVGFRLRFGGDDAVAVGGRGVVPDADRRGLSVLLGRSGAGGCEQECQDECQGLFHGFSYMGKSPRRTGNSFRLANGRIGGGRRGIQASPPDFSSGLSFGRISSPDPSGFLLGSLL